ncbi:MAG: DUF402 domain-containing protein [Lachnospiraceae bacterium]|nr:DUF402 domain-containing protein [Lachnospiraceae bacterium]
MSDLILYRRRLIPSEMVLLKDDVILASTEDVIVTKWNALKPRKHLHHGYSCYFLKEGIKVSKFYTSDDSLIYWYCDIVDYDRNEDKNELIVTDLLADVIVMPDGFVKVVDLDELVTALNGGLITQEMLLQSISRLDKLLKIIYDGKFNTLTDYIENEEKKEEN